MTGLQHVGEGCKPEALFLDRFLEQGGGAILRTEPRRRGLLDQRAKLADSQGGRKYPAA
jgi:hypothetical protein